MGRHRPAQAQAAQQLSLPARKKAKWQQQPEMAASPPILPPPQHSFKVAQSSYVPFLHLQPYAKIAYS